MCCRRAGGRRQVRRSLRHPQGGDDVPGDGALPARGHVGAVVPAGGGPAAGRLHGLRRVWG